MADSRIQDSEAKSQKSHPETLAMQDSFLRMQLAAQTPAGGSNSTKIYGSDGTSADDWKKKGNDEFIKSHYSEAIVSYNTALHHGPTTEEKLVIRNNRVMAYLKDGRFDEALTEGLELSSIPQTEEKAMFRTAQAYYELGNFPESLAMLSKLIQKYPNQDQARKCLKRVKARLDEQQTGKYAFLALNKEAAILRPPELDHATFIGAVIVKNSPGRGRGLFTTKAFKAGDLILCEKAFAHAHKEYTPASHMPLSFQTTNKHLVNQSTQTDMILKLVEKVSTNRSLYSQVTDLFHGSFDAPASTVGHKRGPHLDPLLANEIVRFNAFGSDLISREKHMRLAGDNSREHFCSGLWLKASLINHCCYSNARRAFIGDFLIVRASRDIAANTEVTFTYNRPNGDGDNMQKGLVNWGFECKCAVCTDWNETSTEVKSKRKKLLANLETSLNKSNFNAAAAEATLINISKTYKPPPTEVPRFALFSPYMQLAFYYHDTINQDPSNCTRCLSALLDGLKALGFIIKNGAFSSSKRSVFRVEKWGVMVDDVVKAFVCLWNVYWALQQVQNLDVVADCGRLAYKICVGEDETYTQSYGDSSA